MAEIIGKKKRVTDKSREKYDAKGQRFLDNAQKHRGDVIKRWRRRMGKTKAFGSLCPPDRPWPWD